MKAVTVWVYYLVALNHREYDYIAGPFRTWAGAWESELNDPERWGKNQIEIMKVALEGYV